MANKKGCTLKVVIDARASVLKLRARGEDTSIIHPLINLITIHKQKKTETLHENINEKTVL